MSMMTTDSEPLFTGGERALLLEVERDDDDGRDVDEGQAEAGDDSERDAELRDGLRERAGQAAGAGDERADDGGPATAEPGGHGTGDRAADERHRHEQRADECRVAPRLACIQHDRSTTYYASTFQFFAATFVYKISSRLSNQSGS